MCPISGGNWNNSSNAGVWTLNLNNVRDTSNDVVGFRADSISPHGSQDRSGIKGDTFRRVVCSTAKSECFRFSGRAGIAGLEGLAI
jgi:hypothetical protein